jgi:hypothetical protein
VKLEKYDIANMDERGISTACGEKAAWFKDTEGNIIPLSKTAEILEKTEPTF